MIDIPALQSLFDDEMLVRKYLERFEHDMPALLRNMRTAFTQQQWQELSRHAHSFKSQMQYINDTSASFTAHELEQLSAAGSPDIHQIDAHIGQLENQLEKILLAIQQING